MRKDVLKQYIVLIFCFMFLILTSACGGNQDNQKQIDEPENSINLDAFLQTVNLPENFSLAFDESEVKSVDSAKVYKAASLELDADEIAGRLLKGKIISTEISAQGPWFEAENESFKEYLTVFDGGKSFGIDSGLEGGLSYSVYRNDEQSNPAHSELLPRQPGPPDSIAQRWGYNLKSDYASFADLSFMNYKDSLAAVEKVLYDTLGFPGLEVAETYSIDLETTLKHYELYLDSREYFRGEEDEEEDEVILTKDDECYVFFFRQLIDDIPVINLIWDGGVLTDSAAETAKQPIQTAAGNVMPGTDVNVCYDRSGVRSISAYNLYKIIESGEKRQLVSPAKALQVVIDEYSEILLAGETIVESMELCYAVIPSEDSCQLIPAWVFCIAEAENETDQTGGTKKTIYSYEIYVVDAITGAKISS